MTGEIPEEVKDLRMIAHFSEFSGQRCSTNDDGCRDGRDSFTTPDLIRITTTPDPLDLRITTPGRRQEEAAGVENPSSLEQEGDRLGDDREPRLPVDIVDMVAPTFSRNPVESDHVNEDHTSRLEKESSGLEHAVSIDLIITAQMAGNNMKSDMVRSQSDAKSKRPIKQESKTIEFVGDSGASKEAGGTLDCDSNAVCDNENTAAAASQQQQQAAGAASQRNNGGLRRSGSSCSDDESKQNDGSCANKEPAEIITGEVETGNIRTGGEPVTPSGSAATATQLCPANGANCRRGMSFDFDEVFAELDLRPGRDDEAETLKLFLIEDTTQDGELTTVGMTEGHSTEATDATESPKSLVCLTGSTTMTPENDIENQATSKDGCEFDVEAATADPAVESGGLLSELEGLKAFEIGLSGRDQKIVLALMELEELRGKQHDMKHEIQVRDISSKNDLIPHFFQAMLSKLEGILLEEDANRTKKSSDQETGNEQEARSGKTLSPESKQKVVAVFGSVPGLVQAKVASTNTTFHFFNNLEHQIHSQLQNRLHFLEVISNTMQRELQTFKQTVDFLKRIVNFKLDQTEILLGKMNPITEILQSGSTSIFLLITSFFEAVEAVFVLKSDFVRAFNGQSMDKKEANLLERIIELKLKTILPRKLRLLVNIYAHSEELRAMIGEIFRCVGELLIAKRDLIAAVGSFVEQKVRLWQIGR